LKKRPLKAEKLNVESPVKGSFHPRPSSPWSGPLTVNNPSLLGKVPINLPPNKKDVFNHQGETKAPPTPNKFKRPVWLKSVGNKGLPPE